MEFGESRLAQILSRHAQTSPEHIKSILLKELQVFRKGAELRDDTTFVVITRSARSEYAKVFLCGSVPPCGMKVFARLF
jgi:hypothetical protein